MDTQNASLPKLVKAYRALRTARTELKATFDQEDEALSVKQEQISKALLQHCSVNDVTSVKTEEGTFYRKKKVNYWCSDWEGFHKWVLEKGIPEVLQKRISQRNLQEHLETSGEIPVGLQSDAVYTITVQKPRGS
tara:strand:+ start:2462 stop:2866 length:405 start_codon:yes stop_codon:yes gene_type:complete